MAGGSGNKLLAGTVILLAATLGVLVLDALGSGRMRLPVGKGAPSISLGERHGLILASDGSLWTWGADLLGWPVLGLGNARTTSTALRRIGKETDWIGISAGETHSLALKSDGTLWTWGESVQPQSVGPKPISSPVLAAPGNDWKQATAGGTHSLAVKKNGTLWAWGNNWAGSVGLGAGSKGSAVPMQIGQSTNWVKVWAGILESVGLQSDGSLW
jgi:alpha-tubulin suppressor-like RCC1 family protein